MSEVIGSTVTSHLALCNKSSSDDEGPALTADIGKANAKDLQRMPCGHMKSKRSGSEMQSNIAGKAEVNTRHEKKKKEVRGQTGPHRKDSGLLLLLVLSLVKQRNGQIDSI